MKLSEIIQATQEIRPDTNNTGTQSLEIEYSYFAKANVSELIAKFAEDPEITHEHFIEATLTQDPKVGKLRMRHFPNVKSMPVTRLEKKEKLDTNRAVETAVDIPDGFLRPLLSLSKSVNARLRYYVPVRRGDGSIVKRRDNTLLMWQVDMFINNLDPEEKLTADAISEWIKIEIEVDKDTLSAESVGRMIPFDYQHLIDARSKDDNERTLISNLYDTVYNLSGRGTVLDNSDTSSSEAASHAINHDEFDFDANSNDAGDDEEKAEDSEDKKDSPPSDAVADNDDDDDDFDFNV